MAFLTNDSDKLCDYFCLLIRYQSAQTIKNSVDLYLSETLPFFHRAHFLDAKSLSVYGVYMPRTNPHGIFMTGHAKRSRDKGQNIPAVPPGICNTCI